jgi:hypothetical protein
MTVGVGDAPLPASGANGADAF